MNFEWSETSLADIKEKERWKRPQKKLTELYTRIFRFSTNKVKAKEKQDL